MADTVDALEAQGATVVTGADLDTGPAGAGELFALECEFKTDIATYLQAYTAAGFPKTLADLLAFNAAHRDLEGPSTVTNLPWNDQIWLDAEATNGRAGQDCQDARAPLTAGAQASIDDTLAPLHLDAIIAPTNGPAWVTDPQNGDDPTLFIGSSSPPAVSGYPAITVPAGYVGHLPIGVTFIGGRWSEPQLLGYAYDFEQATHVRVPPTFLPTETASAASAAQAHGQSVAQASAGASSHETKRAVVPARNGSLEDAARSADDAPGAASRAATRAPGGPGTMRCRLTPAVPLRIVGVTAPSLGGDVGNQSARRDEPVVSKRVGSPAALFGVVAASFLLVLGGLAPERRRRRRPDRSDVVLDLDFSASILRDDANRNRFAAALEAIAARVDETSADLVAGDTTVSHDPVRVARRRLSRLRRTSSLLNSPADRRPVRRLPPARSPRPTARAVEAADEADRHRHELRRGDGAGRQAPARRRRAPGRDPVHRRQARRRRASPPAGSCPTAIGCSATARRSRSCRSGWASTRRSGAR